MSNILTLFHVACPYEELFVDRQLHADEHAEMAVEHVERVVGLVEIVVEVLVAEIVVGELVEIVVEELVEIVAVEFAVVRRIAVDDLAEIAGFAVVVDDLVEIAAVVDTSQD